MSEKPLVYHLITKLELGGAQRVTLQTLENMDRNRFRAGLITGSVGEIIDEARKIKECRIHLLPSLKHPIRPLSDLKALLSIRKILRQEKASIVHTHSSKAGIVGRWAAFLAGVPVRIHSVHGWSFNKYQNIVKRTIFTLLERITALITTHFFLETKVHIETGFKKRLFKNNNYSLLRPGIDFSPFDRLSKTKSKPPEPLGGIARKGKKIITMVACFKPQKNPLDFVMAASIVMKQMPSAHFVMVGDGILRKQVESEIKGGGLERSFTLLGWRRDIPQVLKASDCLVLTSLWEGLPTIIPMAMRMSVPVVANKVDGCGEIIIDGKNGLLSEPGRPDTTAGKIVQLLNDKSLYHKITSAGMDSTEQFDIRRTTQLQEKTYEKSLNDIKKNPVSN